METSKRSTIARRALRHRYCREEGGRAEWGGLNLVIGRRSDTEAQTKLSKREMKRGGRKEDVASWPFLSKKKNFHWVSLVARFIAINHKDFASVIPPFLSLFLSLPLSIWVRPYDNHLWKSIDIIIIFLNFRGFLHETRDQKKGLTFSAFRLFLVPFFFSVCVCVWKRLANFRATVKTEAVNWN